MKAECTGMMREDWDALNKIAFDHSYGIQKLFDRREGMDSGVFQLELEDLLKDMAVEFVCPIIYDLNSRNEELQVLREIAEEA